MAFKAITVTVLYLLASCAAQQNCSAVQCKLVTVREDVASEFQSIKTSEEGVRMIYLRLEIGNDSYHPLKSQNEFLPYRWVWAANINELMLSLSYDYDIFSLGLLKRQVRSMEVPLEDEPKGCLASLNSSCQNIVVAQALLRNVTTTYVSGGLHFSKDVVCVAEIDDHLNFYENFLEGDVEYRCCNVVKQGKHNLTLQCELKVQKSNWFKAFYVVLNVLTIVVGIYSPAVLFLLPDLIFDFEKELENEQYMKQKGYNTIPSTQEMQLRVVRDSAAAAESDNRNATGPNERETDSSGPNESGPNSNDPNSDIQNLQPVPDATVDVKEDEEKRKPDEIPVDDASPFNFSTVLYTCKSTNVFREYSTKLPFNIKLAFLWYCLMPIVFYIELALIYTLKDEYSSEIERNNSALLVGGLFSSLSMSNNESRIILIVSYLVLPLLIIPILKPEDFWQGERKCFVSQIAAHWLKEESLCLKLPFNFGNELLKHLEVSRELIVRLMSKCVKAPVHVFIIILKSCECCIKVRTGRYSRLLWVLAALLSSFCAAICSAITAAFSLLIFLVGSVFVILVNSPYMCLFLFFMFKLIIAQKVFFFIISSLITGLMYLFIFLKLNFICNPGLYLVFSMFFPLFLALYSCRFVIKMFGYTIMGLIINADVAAPIGTFVAMVTTYLYGCYANLQDKYKPVKEIISKEWQKQAEHLVVNGKAKVTKDTIPKRLFWYVCDESKVLPVHKEFCLMFRDMAIIFLSAFFALSSIFFGSDSYKIPPVASTITVFVSGTVPMLILRRMDQFNGWKKITAKRRIKSAVGGFIKHRLLAPEQTTNGTQPPQAGVNPLLT